MIFSYAHIYIHLYINCIYVHMYINICTKKAVVIKTKPNLNKLQTESKNNSKWKQGRTKKEQQKNLNNNSKSATLIATEKPKFHTSRTESKFKVSRSTAAVAPSLPTVQQTLLAAVNRPACTPQCRQAAAAEARKASAIPSCAQTHTHTHTLVYSA